MKTFLIALLGVVLLALAGWGLGWFSLATGRPMAGYAAETSRLTESNSRNRVDGVNAGIVSLCLNMRAAPDTNTKRAFASMIVTDADSFQRQALLTDAARTCRQEAEIILNPT